MSVSESEDIKNGAVLEFMDAEAIICNGRHPAIKIHFSERGEILSPKILSISDAEKLLTGLAYALSNHGDEVATRMIEEYFTESEEIG